MLHSGTLVDSRVAVLLPGNLMSPRSLVSPLIGVGPLSRHTPWEVSCPTSGAASGFATIPLFVLGYFRATR